MVRKQLDNPPPLDKKQNKEQRNKTESIEQKKRKEYAISLKSSSDLIDVSGGRDTQDNVCCGSLPYLH
jgi:hypothetical protein